MGLETSHLKTNNALETNMKINSTSFMTIDTPVWLNVCMWLLVAGIFIASPYWSGLYFVNHMLPTSIAISLFAGIVFIWLFSSRVTLKSDKLWKTFYPYLGLLVLVYLVDTFISPAQSDLAVEGVIRQFATIGVVAVCTILLQSLRAKKVFLGVLLVAGSWTSLFALAAGYGSIQFPGAIMQPGNRLASVFQYANTNASFAAAVLFISIFFPLLLKNNMSKTLTSLATYLILLNLTLTYSRGTWITFAILAVLLVILLPKSRRLPLILGNIPSLLVFALTINYQTKATQSTLSSIGWTSLIIGLVVTALLSHSLNKYVSLKTIILPKWGRWIFVVFVLLGIAILGTKIFHYGNVSNSIFSRISNISLKDHSVQERFVYYKDGISMFLKHPLFGDGFGTWTATFQSISSYPYWSKHEHSYWIQLLVETGLVGVGLFVTALVFYFSSIYKVLRPITTVEKSHKRDENEIDLDEQDQRIISWISLFTVGSILFHASIDFDMSYGIMNFFLWAMMIIGVRDLKLVQRISGFKLVPLSTLTGSLYGLGFLSMFGVLVLSVTAYSAENYSLLPPGNSNVFLNLQNLKTAQSLAGYNSQYALTTARLADSAFMQNNNVNFARQALQYVNIAANLAPNDPDTLLSASQISYKYGQFTQALAYAEKAYKDGRFGPQYIEQYMVYLAFQAEENLKKNPTLAKEYNLKLLTVWNDTQTKDKEVRVLPSYLPPEKPFGLTDQMKLRAAEADMMNGQVNDAKTLLISLTRESKDPSISLTAKMVWNVMLNKHLINGQIFNVQIMIASNASISHEFNLLMGS